jgi:Zn-finger protein
MANQCEYFPCHSRTEFGFKCDLCYCPEYYSNCSGNAKWIIVGSSKVKDCSECTVPHDPEYVSKHFKEKKNGSNGS